LATISKRSGAYQARVRRVNQPAITKTFQSKRDAMLWALSIERDLELGIQNDVNALPVSSNPPPTQAPAELTKPDSPILLELFTRYSDTVSVLKRGAAKESVLIKALMRFPLAKVRADELTARDIANFRDERLKTVTGSTVCRELNLISAVLNHAKMEWCMTLDNPCSSIRRPAQNKGRERTLSQDEEKRLIEACSLSEMHRQDSRTSEASWVLTRAAIQLALESAMRRGELLKLKWCDVDLTKRTLTLRETKNGEVRVVPLTPKALDVLQNLPRTNELVFPISESTLHHNFGNACTRANLSEFKFHDLRHSATSRLCRLVPNVVELSRITGHKTLGMLNRYYHVSAEELAIKLAGGAA